MEIYDFIDELAGILMNKNCVYVPHVHLEDQEVFVVASKTRTCFEMLDLEFWGMFRLVRHIPQFSFKRVDGLKLMESEDAWFRVRGGGASFPQTRYGKRLSLPKKFSWETFDLRSFKTFKITRQITIRKVKIRNTKKSYNQQFRPGLAWVLMVEW